MNSLKTKVVVVVGAGLAGITIANALNSKMKVYVIEKGPIDGFEKPKNIFKSKKFGSTETYVYGVGGTTHLWHNGLMEVEPELVNGSFKQIVNSAQKYINKAATTLGLKSNFEESKTDELKHYRECVGHSETSSQLVLDTILVPKTNQLKTLNQGITVLAHSQIVSFELENQKVKSVTVKVANGLNKIDCDYLVISAGGINSPNIVLRLLDEAGIKHDNQNGKGFIDHPMGFLGKIKAKKNHKKMFKAFCKHDSATFSSRCGIVVKTQGLNHVFYFRPAMSMTNDLALYKFKSALGTAPWSRKIKMIFERKFYHPDILIEVISHLFGTPDTNYFSIWGVFEQERLQERGVRVADDGTNYINWYLSDEEIKSYKHSLSKLSDLLKPYIEEITLAENDIDQYTWSAAHHSSTLTYGKEPWQLSPELKINGLNNTFVCDGSVIEQNAYVNTGLLIAQLSLRLSEHINSMER